MRIGLVACSKNKLAAPAPAKELYQGQLFKAAREYCEQNYDTWLILSALHGLVSPGEIIAPYDITLNNMGTKKRYRWAEKVYQQIKSLGLQHDYYFHAGMMYREYLQLYFKFQAPLEGLGIGRQLKWYKERRP